MKELKQSFFTVDGLKIIYRKWLLDQPKGNLVIVHGAGEHSLRYRNTIEHYLNQWFNVFAWDARGHGESDGTRGHVKHGWQDFRQDLHDFFRNIEQDFHDLPVFLFGHSLGGLKTLDYVLHYPNENINGYICSSPAIGEVGVSPVLLSLAKVFNKLWPGLSMETGLDIQQISRDPAWIEETQSDKLYHGKGTPRLAIEVQKTAAWVQDNAQKLNYPILMVHGTADQICEIGGSRTFFDNAQQEDKTLLEYEGGYHELLNDLDKQRVLNDIQTWVEARL